uniref:Uncharacterized protein n=1 Tax=Anopheles melas TaxID=34690 RepID=A0A182UDE6_9DIPT
MSRRLLLALLLVALVALDPTSALQKKKKRGIYHGLHGFALAGHAAIPLHGAAPSFHKGYHPSPYARFPGLHKGAASLGGSVLPPGYALFPGGASVTSYQRNFPRYPTLYGAAGLYPAGFGVAPVKPAFAAAGGFAPPLAAAGFTPYAPALPAYPAALPAVPAAYPQAFVPVGAPAATGSTQQTYFATYPQKPLIPVAVPVQPAEPAKVPVVVQKPFYTAFSTVGPNGGGLLPAGVYSPVSSVPQPQFVGIPVATGSATGVTPSIATTLTTGTTQVTQAPQQPWRPVVVNQPTPAPPSNAYLPSYATSQGQIYISSTPAPTLHGDHHQQQQQAHHQALLEYEQGSLHHQEGNGPFNGQPYDVASNNGRYTGPSSYDVDITHNGYQKKKKLK